MELSVEDELQTRTRHLPKRADTVHELVVVRGRHNHFACGDKRQRKDGEQRGTQSIALVAVTGADIDARIDVGNVQSPNDLSGGAPGLPQCVKPGFGFNGARPLLC